MSPVDRREIGMPSSVMRAPKHMEEAHALRGQRASWRSFAAALVVRDRRDHGSRRLAVGPCVVRTTIVEGHSRQSACRRIRARWMLGTAPVPVSTTYLFSPAELERLKAYRVAVQAGFYSDWR